MLRAKLLFCAFLLCLCLWPTGQALHAATFSNPQRLQTSADPFAIVSGDLNGDGVPDFVWIGTNSSGSGFNVYLSQPGGGWLPGNSFPFPASSSISSCALVDVNLDKNLDLVCSGSYTFTAYVHVFLGNGDGTFQAPITNVVPLGSSGSYPDTVLASEGDLNGDGLPDFFFEDRASYGGYILLSDGKGGFRPPIQVSSSINNVVPFAADVNGDGIPDLLYPEGPEVALGKGDGTFGPVVSYEQPSYYLATCIFHDMDGDGHLDAVCGYAETTTGDITGATDLIILHGNPDGSFNTTPISQTRFGDYDTEYDGFGTFQYPLYVADVNGDGILDVIGGSGDGLAVLYGGPNLTYNKPLHYAVGLIQPLTTGAYSLNQGQVLDVNGDGHPDVVATGPNGIYVSYGKPDGTFTAAFAPEVAEVIGYPTVADFNGDGIPDIAATGDTAIKVSFGKGDGTFSAPVALGNNTGGVNFSTPLSATNAHIAHGDFNGDGKVDLMVIGSPSIYVYQSYILWGNGDGTFQEPVEVPGSTVVYPMYESLVDQAVYDINGDGRSDLVANGSAGIGSISDRIVSSLSNGDGTFTTVATLVPYDNNGSTSYGISLPALADFNGDGKLDAAYGSLNHVYVVKGHGDGSFDTTGAVLAIPTISGRASLGSLSIAAADIDGDGKQDVAVLVQYGAGQYPYPSQFATAVWVYFGNGDGTFSSPVLAGQFDRNYTNVAAADLDLSGRADLIVKTSGSLGGGYAVGVLSSLPGRTFGPEVNYFAGTGLSNLEIADVNQDGRPDLVFGNGDYNLRASSVTVLLNQGTAPVVSGVLTAAPEPSVAGQNFNLLATLTPPSPTSLGGSVSFTIDGNNVGTAPLANNSATLPVALALSVGTHSIGALWPGDTTYSPVTLSGVHNVIAIPTSTTLTSSSNPASAGTQIVFTATTSSTAGAPPGTITFAEGGSTLATVPLAAGVAQYSTSSLAIGTDTVTASYAANGNFAASSASLNQVINGLASTASLTASPNPAYAGQTVTLSGAVAAQNGTPTGTLTFYDGATLLGTATLNASGKATLTAAFAIPGTHNLSAEYSGDAVYSAQISPIYAEDVLINPTAISVTASPNPSAAFNSISFSATVHSSTGLIPNGSVVFSANGAQIGSGVLQSGVASLSTSSLGAGTYSVTATYPGNSAFATAISAPYSLIVTQAASQTTVASSLNPAPAGSSVTFTATTTTAGSVVPAGLVQFFDGTVPMSTPVSLNALGIATFNTGNLAVGTHPITAVFAGNANLLSSTSAVLQQSIVPYIGDFTIALRPGSAGIYTGESASVQVAVTSVNGFNEPLTLGCAGLPAQATCTFTPASLVGGQGTATLVIQTAAPQQIAAMKDPNSPPVPARPWPKRNMTPAVLVAFLGLFFIPSRFRRRFFCLIALAICAGLASDGCGNPPPIAGGTPPGTYNIAVSATYSGATPALQHSADFDVTVKSLF